MEVASLGPYDEQLTVAFVPAHSAEVVLAQYLELAQLQRSGFHDDYRGPAFQQLCIKFYSWYIGHSATPDKSIRCGTPDDGRTPR